MRLPYVILVILICIYGWLGIFAAAKTTYREAKIAFTHMHEMG